MAYSQSGIWGPFNELPQTEHKGIPVSMELTEMIPRDQTFKATAVSGLNDMAVRQ